MHEASPYDFVGPFGIRTCMKVGSVTSTPRDSVHTQSAENVILKNARITFGSNTPPLPLCGQAQDLTLQWRGCTPATCSRRRWEASPLKLHRDVNSIMSPLLKVDSEQKAVLRLPNSPLLAQRGSRIRGGQGALNYTGGGVKYA